MLLRKVDSWMTWFERGGHKRLVRQKWVALQVWVAAMLMELWMRVPMLREQYERQNVVIDQLRMQLATKLGLDVPAELVLIEERHDKYIDQLNTKHKLAVRELEALVYRYGIENERMQQLVKQVEAQRDRAITFVDKQGIQIQRLTQRIDTFESKAAKEGSLVARVVQCLNDHERAGRPILTPMDGRAREVPVGSGQDES